MNVTLQRSFYLLVLFGFSSLALTQEIKSAELQMLEALENSDFIQFAELLEAGADPNQPTGDDGFRSTNLCASTRLGKEEYFELLVNAGVSLDHISEFGGYHGSVMACAITNQNFKVYRRLVELGVDVNSIQNPAATTKSFHKTPLSFALFPNRFDIAWDIVQQIELSDRQTKRLIRALERRGIEGHPDQPYKDKLTAWLADRGIEVNPPKLAPKELYEQK